MGVVGITLQGPINASGTEEGTLWMSFELTSPGGNGRTANKVMDLP